MGRLKKEWSEKREDRKVERGTGWGADGGRLEETRVIEMLEAKWTKQNDTVSLMRSSTEVVVLLLFLPLTWFRRSLHRLSRRRARCWRRCRREGRFIPSSPFSSRCWTPRPWKLCVLRRIGQMNREPIRALTTRRRESRRPGLSQGLRGSIGAKPQVTTDDEFNVLSRLSALPDQTYCH